MKTKKHNLKNLWTKLLHIGIPAEQSFPLAQQIKKTNLVAIILFACASIVGASLMLLKLPVMDPLAFVIAFAFLLVSIVNYFEYHTLSRILLIFILNSALNVFSIALGRDSGTHFWFLTSSLILIVIFNSRHAKFWSTFSENKNER